MGEHTLAMCIHEVCDYESPHEALSKHKLKITALQHYIVAAFRDKLRCMPIRCNAVNRKDETCCSSTCPMTILHQEVCQRACGKLPAHAQSVVFCNSVLDRHARRRFCNANLNHMKQSKHLPKYASQLRFRHRHLRMTLAIEAPFIKRSSSSLPPSLLQAKPRPSTPQILGFQGGARVSLRLRQLYALTPAAVETGPKVTFHHCWLSSQQQLVCSPKADLLTGRFPRFPFSAAWMAAFKASIRTVGSASYRWQLQGAEVLCLDARGTY